MIKRDQKKCGAVLRFDRATMKARGTRAGASKVQKDQRHG
jgi:hypothetical protein